MKKIKSVPYKKSYCVKINDTGIPCIYISWEYEHDVPKQYTGSKLWKPTPQEAIEVFLEEVKTRAAVFGYDMSFEKAEPKCQTV